jgi:hypothetical protein
VSLKEGLKRREFSDFLSSSGVLLICLTPQKLQWFRSFSECDGGSNSGNRLPFMGNQFSKKGSKFAKSSHNFLIANLEMI